MSMLPSASQPTTTTRMPAMTARGRVGAVGGGGDQADVAGMVAAAVVPGADGEQAGILALAAGVGLERDGVEAGDLLEPGLEVAEQGLVAGGLVLRARRGGGCANSGQVTGIISAVALSFMVQEPSGIMARSSAMSLAWRRRR